MPNDVVMTFGERAAYAGQMLLIGMGAIFLSLAVLWGVVELFRRIVNRESAEADQPTAAPAPTPVAAPAPAPTTVSVAPASNDALIAAITAARAGKNVVLLEKNDRLGKKLLITGKGRCNVTNNADIETLMANTPKNGKFLYSAFSKFDGRDAMAFFEKIGVPLKTERGNRVFPVSDRAFDVSGALERKLKALKVALVRDRAVSLGIEEGTVNAVAGEKRTYPADAIILATGGVSYPATGSTGEGHRMASECGHTVTALQGSLVPLKEQGNLCARIIFCAVHRTSGTERLPRCRKFPRWGKCHVVTKGVLSPLGESCRGAERRD